MTLNDWDFSGIDLSNAGGQGLHWPLRPRIVFGEARDQQMIALAAEQKFSTRS